MHGYVSPSATLHPSVLRLFLFLTFICLLARGAAMLAAQAITLVQFSYAHHHEISACTNKPNTPQSLYIRGEKKKKQARCIHHKVYTLIPVHTARRGYISSGIFDSRKRSSLNSFSDGRWRFPAQLSLQLCTSPILINKIL